MLKIFVRNKNVKWCTGIGIVSLFFGSMSCINQSLSEASDIETAVEIRLLQEKAVHATVEAMRQQISTNPTDTQSNQSISEQIEIYLDEILPDKINTP